VHFSVSVHGYSVRGWAAFVDDEIEIDFHRKGAETPSKTRIKVQTGAR